MAKGLLSLVELAQLVDEMRSAQKDYFAYHTRSALEKAKRLEERVDAATLRVLCEVPEPVGLWDEGDGEP